MTKVPADGVVADFARSTTASERTITMGEQVGFDGPAPSGGMAQFLDELLRAPTPGPAPAQDLSSLLLNPAQHFQLDLDQAPNAIAAFRRVAQDLRDLMDEAKMLGDIGAPGLDAVSTNAAKEIGQWAMSQEQGTLRSALESGAQQMELVADVLERSLVVYQKT